MVMSYSCPQVEDPSMGSIGNLRSTQEKEDKRKTILQHRKSLPIASVEKRLVDEVRSNNTLIIVGETGSGKTTQLPQFLLNAGFSRDGKIIGITQPRRVAAISVAKRVAQECGVELGDKVGYSIRFKDVTSSSTRIKYMTDGLLLREALLDPYLSRYSVIIVDEAHERTVQTDVLLGLLKRVQKARLGSKIESTNTQEKEHGGQNSWDLKQCQSKKQGPLKLIIMSASLEARVFSEFYGGAKAVHVQGRQFPVEIFYTKFPETDYVDAALITIFQIHLREEPGDILVFLTGQEEIEAVERLVLEKLRQLPENHQKLEVSLIYSSLPSEKQLDVFKPAQDGYRKVVLATNIAETSVTIPGIKYVIDPGLVKAKTYNARTGIDALIIVPTSKAQALQRSGRAGREQPGKCFRLYPEREFEKLSDSTLPEIKRCDLSNVILQLKALGVDDIIGFDFMEKPNRDAVVKALELLCLLGALTDEYKLSDPVGHQMARLPLEPFYSKAVILATQFNCLEEMLITVAMLSVESIFYMPKEKDCGTKLGSHPPLTESDPKLRAREVIKNFSSVDGDHLTLINVYRACDKFLMESNNGTTQDKIGKMRHWCKANFVNSRSLMHARDVHRQIRTYVENMGLQVASCGDETVQFRRCLAAVFFLKAALKQPDGTYRVLSNGQIVQIHPSSVLFRSKPECVIFNELSQTNNNYIKTLSRIDYLWLPELAPHYFAME